MGAYGIMGGTFDPVHYGHLLMAERACEAAELDRVFFVPAGEPAHKDASTVTPAEMRVEMTGLAVAGNPRFEVSRIEVDRPGSSYAVDTLRQLRDTFPEDDAFFIIGSDTAAEMVTWYQAAELPKLACFLVAERPGYGIEHLHSLPTDFRGGMRSFRSPLVDISSTEIRARVSEGRSIRYMTPPDVCLFIERHKLYSNSL